LGILPSGLDRSEKIGYNKDMKIAIPFENGEIFQHFGKTEAFKIYETDGEKILRSAVVPTNGKGHGELAGFLREQGVDTLLCGGIGMGAQQALAELNIRIFGGVTGDPDAAAQALLNGTLSHAEGATCDHHHDHGGNCGSHGCGHHNENQ